MKSTKLALLALAGIVIGSPAATGSPATRTVHRHLAVAQPVGVKIVLHPTASVLPDSNGFFTLADIADISGGTPETREKLNEIEVGRAPMDSSYTRQLNSGDVALKLREAGVDPYHDVTLTGAADMVISTAEPQVMMRTVASTTPGAPALMEVTQAPVIVIKNGDPITLVLQDGPLTVTATGEARQNGAVGDVIHVHRIGVMSDLEGQIVDAHTVQLEL